MTFPQLPYVAPPAGTYATPCDSRYEEIAATREINYIVFPGTVDEHGSSLAICDDPACEAKARAYIAQVGDVIEVVALTQPTFAVAAFAVA